MKKLFFSLLMLGMGSASAATIFYNYYEDQLSLPDNGVGSYAGFSINLGGDLTTLNGGSDDLGGATQVYLNTLSVYKSGTEGGEDNCYFALFKSSNVVSQSNFVGVSTEAINMAGSGVTSLVSVNFNNVQIELGQTYYVMFSSSLPSATGNFNFSNILGRLAIGEASDSGNGIISNSSIVYKSASAVSIESGWLGVYNAEVSAIPEPSTAMMGLVGLGGLLMRRRRKA